MLVNITINGKKYTEESSLTILQVYLNLSL